jgi:hypothetical protein
LLARSFVLASLVSAVLSAGCSPKDTTTQKKQPPDPTQAITYDLVQPSLTSLAPSQVSLGDTVTIFGQNFIDPQHGTLSLQLSGTFTDAQGNGRPDARHLPRQLPDGLHAHRPRRAQRHR